jgi:hypothetical protein
MILGSVVSQNIVAGSTWYIKASLLMTGNKEERKGAVVSISPSRIYPQLPNFLLL